MIDRSEDVAFETAYSKMMERSLRNSSSERKRRLLEKHGAVETLFLAQVWWPAIGNLDGLHPEYEIRDFKDGFRFIDFAYIPSPNWKLALEIDGFGPHWRNVSRWQFADNLMRQNHLLLGDWRLLRFAYDDIEEKPRRCQQILLQALGKWGVVQNRRGVQLTLNEQIIIRLAQSLTKPVTPARISSELGFDRKTSVKYLQSLANKGYFTVIFSQSGRAMRYELVASNLFEDVGLAPTGGR